MDARSCRNSMKKKTAPNELFVSLACREPYSLQFDASIVQELER